MFASPLLACSGCSPGFCGVFGKSIIFNALLHFEWKMTEISEAAMVAGLQDGLGVFRSPSAALLPMSGVPVCVDFATISISSFHCHAVAENVYFPPQMERSTIARKSWKPYRFVRSYGTKARGDMGFVGVLARKGYVFQRMLF